MRSPTRPSAVIAAALFALFSMTLALSFPAPAGAQIPLLIRYQGTLTDSNGSPLEGNYSLTFRFYDSASAGTMMWQETQTSVPVTQGKFTVLLGQVSSLSLKFDQDCWLALSVNGSAELSPRTRVASVPNAYLAGNADRLYESEKIQTANLCKNGSLESWSGGPSAAPDGWALTNATVSRNTADKRLGQAAASVTVGSGSGSMKQTLPAELLPSSRGRPVTLCGWVKTSAASTVRLKLSDGVGSTESAPHPGDGAWKMLSVTRTVDANATSLQGELALSAPGSATLDCVGLNEGIMPFAFSPHPGDPFLVPRSAVQDGTVSTTSLSYVPFPGMKIENVTVDGTQSVALAFHSTVDHAHSQGHMAFHFRRNGAQITGSTETTFYPGGYYYKRPFSMQHVDKKPPAGTYTYEVYWVEGSGYAEGRAAGSRMSLMVVPDA